ncbi:MAG: TolC family protein [Armatimonadetes bacterium]|nr:TolC family protein [Armatimonadota bacterium]
MIGLWTVPFALVGSQDVLTKDEAIRIAMERAFSLRISEVQVRKSRQQESQARGAFGPNITLQGNYTRIDGSSFSTGGSGGSGSFDSKTASVSVSETIDVSGTIRRALRAAEFNRMAAEAGLGAEANALKLKVRRSYDDVLLSKALVEVQNDAVRASKERLDKARVRFENGAVPRFDVLRFENELRKSEQAVVQAQGNVKTSKQSLNSSLSRPIETEFEPVPVDSLPALPSDLTGLVVLAVKNRDEVRQSGYIVTALTEAAYAQEAGNKPQLVLQATHSRNLDPPAGSRDNGTTSSAVISFPIFDSGRTRHIVEQALSDRDIAKIQFEQLLLSIALEVRSAHTQADTAKQAYDVAVDSERLATEALRLAEIRYNEGAGILIDVIQAQADLTAARGNVQTAKYGYLNAYAALQKAVGRDDLNAVEGT